MSIGVSHPLWQTYCFVGLAVVDFCLFLRVLVRCRQPHYRESKIFRVLFPSSLLLMTYDNSLTALGDILESDGPMAKSAFVLHPFIVPTLIMVTFEMAYIVHKKRSVNFCGIQFDEGRRVKVGLKSWILRNAVFCLSTALIVTGAVVNFDLVHSSHVDDTAGNVGLLRVFEGVTEAGGGVEGQVHRILAFVPVAFLVTSNLYVAIIMWMYGSNSSMIIHASWLNPWVCQFIGTVGLACGQLPAGPHFKLTSNAGESFLVLSIAFLMNEVDRDMSAAREFTDFLGVIEGKTNSRDENRQIKASIRGVKAPTHGLSKSKFWGFGNGGGADPGKQAMVVQNLDVAL
mmetsp:Transcript_16345/g.33298  ORF Transcript_16345/g.33298 Transcript_16345/m.33298 type:complete len:343 (-) Transcript_16345:52-1080(-)